MKILTSKIPPGSLLNTTAMKYHYVDSFAGTLVDKDKKLDSTDTGKAFFAASPKWVGKLFWLRNQIMRPFGLKTYGINKERQANLEKFTCEPGDRVGLFRVLGKTKNEVVFGEDDKHLNFRVSLFLEEVFNEHSERKLTISTTVVFNTQFGRLYFMPVRPFHRLIVPAMLKAMIIQLETGQV